MYDYIIIGAGVGGLSAGLNLVKHGKKVLILEKNSLPGGLTSTFKRGRFEFDTSIYDLYDYGNSDHIGSLQKELQALDINIDAEVVPMNTRVKILDKNQEYVINGEVEDWFLTLESLRSNSIEALRNLLPIIKEIHEALEKLKNNIEIKETDYPYFYKYLDVCAQDALFDLKIPKNTIHYLGYLWVDLASPLNKLSFIDFSDFMYKFMFKKPCVLKEKNLSFILKLVARYEELGGKIYTRSEVGEIDNGEIKKVKLLSGEEYEAREIICDLSPHYVFKDLVKQEYPDVNRLENARTLSCSSLVVYLGLNKSVQELGLKNYKYYQFQNLDSSQNIKNMYNLNHRTFEAYVPNIVNEKASPNGTSILILKTNYYGNAFSNITCDYELTKRDLAADLIREFESAFHIDITTYIEEIEIATPYTFLHQTNNPNGSIYGYMRSGYDNGINRLINYEMEKVSGLSFVGASSVLASGVDNAFASGIYITNKLLEGSDK